MAEEHKFRLGVICKIRAQKTQEKQEKDKNTSTQAVVVEVPPKSVVCIKELLYETEHTHMCVAQVTMKKTDVLKYTYKEGYRVAMNPPAKEEKWTEIKIEKLMKTKQEIGRTSDQHMKKGTKQAFDLVSVEGDRLSITFKARCTFTTREPRLQTEGLKVEKQRIKELTKR